MCKHRSQVSQLKGDYKPEAYDVWSIEEPIIAALQSSAVTWAVVAPLVLGAFALLVCNGTLDAAGFTNSVSFTGVSPAPLKPSFTCPAIPLLLKACLWVQNPGSCTRFLQHASLLWKPTPQSKTSVNPTRGWVLKGRTSWMIRTIRSLDSHVKKFHR